MTLPHNIGDWIVIDSGIKTGEEHMGIDEFALSLLNNNSGTRPLLRFFQWTEPTVSYGYLMDPSAVKEWARQQNNQILVKRPSGGGTVLHSVHDLSLSLLWPRGLETFSENPRDCYGQIHQSLQNGLQAFLGRSTEFLSLYKKESGSCETPRSNLSICFQEPVCHDVMIGNKKVIGGALRVTKNAFLYQGNIRLSEPIDILKLKSNLIQALETLLNPTMTFAGSL